MESALRPRENAVSATQMVHEIKPWKMQSYKGDRKGNKQTRL